MKDVVGEQLSFLDQVCMIEGFGGDKRSRCDENNLNSVIFLTRGLNGRLGITWNCGATIGTVTYVLTAAARTPSPVLSARIVGTMERQRSKAVALTSRSAKPATPPGSPSAPKMVM